MNFIIDENGCLHFSYNNIEAFLIADEHNMLVFADDNSLFVEPNKAYTLLAICAKHHTLTIN